MTDKYIPASKLLALKRYEHNGDDYDGFMYPASNGEYIKQSHLCALIDEAPEVESVADDNYQEGTAERLRLICSKLGIGAPVSNEEIMFCQFSLLGAIRRKIDAIYTTPQPDVVSELVKALEDDAFAASFQSMAGYRTALIAKVKGMMG